MPIEFTEGRTFDRTVPVLVVGGGLCGQVAALAARERGHEVMLFERETHLGGSLQIGRGLIPAAGTRYQSESGVSDSPAQLAADLQRRSRGSGDVRLTLAVASAAGPAIEWLADRHGITWQLEPASAQAGHGQPRLHGVPERSGVALMRRLEDAVRRAGVTVLTGTRALDLYATREGRVLGVLAESVAGERLELGCEAIVLASGGYAASTAWRQRFMPEIARAHYAGHRGSHGDALHWAVPLGAAVRNTGAYFARAAFAVTYRQLVSRELVEEGGIQVNLAGERFGNELDGEVDFSSQVMAQPQGVAWTIYDERIHQAALSRPDYREVHAAGAVREAMSAAELAAQIGVSPQVLGRTLALVRDCQRGKAVDPFGRTFAGQLSLGQPLYAVCVTAALLHSQGGLAVDTRARVLREDGSPLPNVLAGGHATCGVSGPHSWGYLPGSGWLCALSLGRIAGESAAEYAGPGSAR
jgi:fumarate reductase flavoprotein subunit